MSKRLTVTIADEHFECLKEIAAQNDRSMSLMVYTIIDDWMRMKALQLGLREELEAILLDQSATGVPN